MNERSDEGAPAKIVILRLFFNTSINSDFELFFKVISFGSELTFALSLCTPSIFGKYSKTAVNEGISVCIWNFCSPVLFSLSYKVTDISPSLYPDVLILTFTGAGLSTYIMSFVKTDSSDTSFGSDESPIPIVNTGIPSTSAS